jgi:hypothetical protein
VVSARRARWIVVVAAVVALAGGSLAGCSTQGMLAAGASTGGPSATRTASTAPSTTPSPTVNPSPSATAKPTVKVTAKPKPTATLKKPVAAGADIPKTTVTAAPSDGVPAIGAGTFSVASGGTDVVGRGTTLVTYRVELEDGIAWGANGAWTPASFAATVDGIVADPRGWTRSANAPITDPAQKLTNASWSFQRVNGANYSVRIRLATPATVDRLCGAMGMDTQGVYSCRYGTTILINLRRWLNGAPGFAMNLAGYRIMVINHEMGHLLGFAHMLCPAAGQPAPVMQEETIQLAGCQPNAYPFAADGTFITGPWAKS